MKKRKKIGIMLFKPRPRHFYASSIKNEESCRVKERVCYVRLCINSTLVRPCPRSVTNLLH